MGVLYPKGLPGPVLPATSEGQPGTDGRPRGAPGANAQRHVVQGCSHTCPQANSQAQADRHRPGGRTFWSISYIFWVHKSTVPTLSFRCKPGLSKLRILPTPDKDPGPSQDAARQDGDTVLNPDFDQAGSGTTGARQAVEGYGVTCGETI